MFCRFRHAVVSAMTGSHRPHKRVMADVVQTQMRLQKAAKEGKVPEGSTLGVTENTCTVVYTY